MSLNDILQIEKERIRRERVVFITVYERMKNRINNAVKAKYKDCIYTIPEFIIGYPLINLEQTMLYLIKKLNKEGFICFAITSNDLYITWDFNELIKLDRQLREHKQPTISDKKIERDNDDLITSLINSKRNRAGHPGIG